MTKSQKIGVTISIVVVIFLILVYLIQNKRLSEKLAHCSSYTIAEVTRVYRLRGMAHVVYWYKIGTQKVENDKSVNVYDTGESWMVNLHNLQKRRLLIQVYCADKTEHRIRWDIQVPDTLRYIPVEGWKELPFKTSR